MSEFVRSGAAPELRGLVSGYSGYRWSGAPGLHHGLPSAHLTLIVCLSGTIDFVGRRRASFVAAAGGLHDDPFVMAHDGLHHGLQLDVTWRGARALLGLPAGELAGTAARCGYADQAHLARDFRALGDLTATRWLAEFPSVQDVDGALGDDGPHDAEHHH